MILFWFRRDLRIEDNVGLYNALNSGKKVLPVFVFDKNILKKIPKSDARIDFIYKNLQKMQLEFYKYGSSMLVAKGNPVELIPKLCEKYKIESVYTNEDYEPYARKRDLEVSEKLSDNGVKFKSFKDQVIFAPNEVLKKDGTPYKVYTPFSKLWISKLESEHIKEYTTINLLNNLHKIPLPNIKQLDKEIILNSALYGGDDYELLFSCNTCNESLVKKLSAKLNLKLTKIGVFREFKKEYIDFKNNNSKPKNSYLHF